MPTPSHVELSTLWVPLMPSTSGMDAAMEQAGKDAKDKFGQATKDIGKPIEEALAQVGTKATDTFSGVGRSAKDSLTSAVRGAGAEMHNALSSAFKDIPTALDSTKQAFAGIDDLARSVGIDLGGWTHPLDKVDPQLDGMDEKLKDALSSVGSISSTFEGLPGKIGAAASKMGVLAGEVGLVVAGLQEAGPYIDALDQKIHDSSGFGKWLEEHSPSTWGQWLGDHLGAKQSREFFGNLFGYDPNLGHNPDANSPLPPGITRGPDGSLIATGGDDKSWYTNDWFFGGTHPTVPSLVPMTGAPNPWWTDRMRHDQWGFTHWEPAPEPHGPRESSPPREHHSSSGGRVGGSGLSSRILGGANSRSGLRAAGGQIANLYAFAQSLEGTPYSKALRNDCSGMVARLANVALGLPPEASFTTVNEGQWLFSHGFEPGLGGPNDLNIGWYDHGGGNLGHTAATLPGGVHAESGGSHGSFLLGPGAAGAEDPQFTQHAHLSMGRGRQVPDGTEHDPIFVAQSQNGSGGGGSPFESQGQELGQGLINGVLQEFGLDGSVFGGKSPLDWGAVKLGGGLLNWGLHTAQSMSGMGAAPSGGGGGMGGLGGLAGLIPSPGAMLSAAAKPAGGSFGIKDAVAGGPTSITHDNRITLTNPTFHPQSPVVRGLQEMQNSRTSGALSGLPVPSIGTP